ncbi:gamma-glutamyltransferase family protein [Rhizobium leguminosarum]|uniref:Putative gamma-glutamyltransferase YwrD n=1 Tax=Rhizobium leguminosarum TaxID=384 RepID=A0A2K9ZHS2_RHILE|nr:gamma-glutamyltransferase family protein [Rhizobium leguminosarum]AUW47778.1 putative gamma-glutamyltransferase YwrD [Rhizobium leguminosarum]
MVTSPHRLASESGARILRDGGNALDAAIAIGATIAVVYPHFCGLGGDAVWIVADEEGRKDCFLGIGQAASILPGFDGGIPLRGPLSALTSACAVDAWRHAHDYSVRNWGGGLSFSSLLDDAIGHAADGFPVTKSQSFWLDFRKSEVADWPGFREVFMPGGIAPQVGTTFRQQELAASLQLIARDGPRSFYEGELGARIAKGLLAAGSPLTSADLAATRTRQSEPASLLYRGVELLAPPPPTQGISTLAIMGILSYFDMKQLTSGGADHIHFCVEAIKRAFLDRGLIADPDFANQPVEDWLSPPHLARSARSIDLERAMDWPQLFRPGDTVFFGVTDSSGRSVSVLQSTYFDWGSGVVVGDTGILWQNRGAAFSIDPRHPNAIAPKKRPFYTLNPGLGLKDGRPAYIYGTQGADGQPQTLSMILTRLIDFGEDPLVALTGPRFLLGKTFSDSRDSLKLEVSAGDAVFAELAARGHMLSPIDRLSPLSGQAGIIARQEDGSLAGAHDPRGDGVALLVAGS